MWIRIQVTLSSQMHFFLSAEKGEEEKNSRKFHFEKRKIMIETLYLIYFMSNIALRPSMLPTFYNSSHTVFTTASLPLPRNSSLLPSPVLSGGRR